jgi:hypothetical protein
MDFKHAIRTSLGMAEFFTQSYLGDLTPAELLVRPAPGANHAAWQLGHLIWAETRLVDAASHGSMPALPEGFMEKHTKDTAASDNPRDFLTKEEYFQLAAATHKATLAALDKCNDADLERAPSGRVPPFVKTGADCFVVAANHWALHAGQWAVLRRKLGRPVQF